MFDDCEYRALATGYSLRGGFVLDVQHAAPPVGGIVQGTQATPQARYEGFEPLPAELSDASHAELNDVRTVLA
jgi:hypothetical protein